MMLQTAPVLMMFPPTTGPNAKGDGQPLRFDFGGCVFIDNCAYKSSDAETDIRI